MNIKSAGLTALAWALAALFALATIAGAWEARSVLVLIVGTVLVSVTAPPGRRWFLKKTGVRLTGWPLVVGCFALLGTQASIQSTAIAARKEQIAHVQRTAAAKALAAAQAATLADFQKNKAAIVTDINQKIDTGQFAEALSTINKYSGVSSDPVLEQAKRLTQIAQAKADLKDEALLPVAKKAKLYGFLAEAEPKNAAYAKKAKAYEKERLAQVAEQERITAKAAWAASIKNQFSPWDGSHRRVERAVKAAMKNPDSYQHVSTSYVTTDSGLIVTTTYRGTNSFGGVVPSTVKAVVDYSGNVVSLKEAR